MQKKIMQQIVLLAGIPGAGKTTLAMDMARQGQRYGLGIVMASADDYFVIDGEYRFDPEFLGQAHAVCQAKVRAALEDGADIVIVHNTLLSAWEREPYLAMGREFGAEVRVQVLEVDPAVAAERCVHGVPADRVLAMAERLDLPYGEHVLLEGAGRMVVVG